MKILTLVSCSVLLAGFGQILLRAGAMQEEPVSLANGFRPGTWVSLLSNGKVLSGLLCWTLSTLIWLAVLTNAQLSYAYCLGSINYVFVPLLSCYLLAEAVQPIRVIGMVLITAGVFVTLYGRYLESSSV